MHTRFPKFPEIGCEIRHLIEFPGYAVSENGDVFSCRNTCWQNKGFGNEFREVWRKIQPSYPRRGIQYAHVVMSIRGIRQNRFVHRLVLEAFVGPCPEGMESCHNDGNPHNNHWSNLRWDTQCANNRDKVLHKSHKGERNPKAKVTEADVFEIKRLYASGLSCQDISERYPVGKTTIHNIVKGATWSHLGEGIPRREMQGDTHPNSKVTEKAVRQIRQLYAEGITQREIAERFNLNRATVGYIVTRKTWSHVP